MRCPFCKQNDDKVIDSRESTDAFVIRRRRECLKCGRRFTTREKIDETPLRVIKRDGGREDFDRRKILSGMITACQKRPVSIQSLEEITQRIEDRLLDGPEREVHTRQIGSLVMRELRRLDKVAYVRFASVYKNFESPEDFAEIAEEVGLQSAPKAEPREGKGPRPRARRSPRDDGDAADTLQASEAADGGESDAVPGDPPVAADPPLTRVPRPAPDDEEAETPPERGS